MSVRIITDSTSDIRDEEIEELNVKVIPLNITFGNDNFVEGKDITVAQFYEKLQSEKSFPKTSQPSPDLYAKEFEDAKACGDEVVCITISTGLSGTYQAANIGKDLAEYDSVYVVDSLTCLTGLRLLVKEACKMRDAGMTAKEIADKLDSLRHRVHIFAICDTMEYFYKGGRISRAAAIAGSLLGIKVFITLDENGKIKKPGQSIGMIRAYKCMNDDIKKHPADPNYEVCYGYTTMSEHYEKMLEKTKPLFEGITTSGAQIGAVSGCHIGPGGICYASILKED